jgi:hypothetical protein
MLLWFVTSEQHREAAAAHVKSLDNKHLVTCGLESLFGSTSPGKLNNMLQSVTCFDQCFSVIAILALQCQRPQCCLPGVPLPAGLLQANPQTHERLIRVYYINNPKLTTPDFLTAFVSCPQACWKPTPTT